MKKCLLLMLLMFGAINAQSQDFPQQKGTLVQNIIFHRFDSARTVPHSSYSFARTLLFSRTTTRAM